MSDFKWDDGYVELILQAATGNIKDFVMQPHQFIDDFKKNWAKKKVLFTTRDGKEISSGDKVSWVVIHGDNSWTVNTAVMSQSSSFNHDRVFSTSDAANEYILMNKPCLSLQDLLSVWHRGDSLPQNESVYASSPMFQDFKELAKQKIK